MSNVSRKHKNNVFCMLYKNRKYLLSLYNAMNGSDYRNADDLEVVTLEHAICLSMKNDAAFLIYSQIYLYEHQSSVNENIPLRDLYYVAEEYKRIAPPSELHKHGLLQIPTPHFVVFYNGKEPQPERKILRLSDLYQVKTAKPELELVVTQYNINSGYNGNILEKCESLKGYMTFVDKVRGKTESGLPVEQAVEKAVTECIREGVLADFFREHKSEVVEMGIYEFDAEVFERVVREESWEEGAAQTLIQQVCRKLVKGKPMEVIAEELEEEPETIRKICSIADQYAPEYDIKKIVRDYLVSSSRY